MRIGVFDSGYGGLTILEQFRALLPEYDYVYFEDLKDPENYILVDTDWCHLATIKWITENLNARYA